MTLEDLEAKHRLTFDAIVMDIEGGEATFILQNIDKLRQIQFLMAEFQPRHYRRPHGRSLARRSPIRRLGEGGRHLSERDLRATRFLMSSYVSLQSGCIFERLLLE